MNKPRDTMGANIERFGWHACHVPDEAGRQPRYSYSVGFERSFGHPEVLLFGLPRAVAQGILADIAKALRDGIRFEPLKRLPDLFGSDLEVLFRPVRDDAFGDFLVAAVDYYQGPFRAWVLLWPDKDGRLPGEPGCRVTVQNDALAILAG